MRHAIATILGRDTCAHRGGGILPARRLGRAVGATSRLTWPFVRVFRRGPTHRQRTPLKGCPKASIAGRGRTRTEPGQSGPHRADRPVKSAKCLGKLAGSTGLEPYFGDLLSGDGVGLLAITLGPSQTCTASPVRSRLRESAGIDPSFGNML